MDSFELLLSAAPRRTWRHFAETDEVSSKELQKLVRDPHAIDALVAEETRPRRARFAEGDIVILHGVNTNPGAAPEDMVSLRIWITEDTLISVCKRGLRSVADMRRRLAEGRGPAIPADLFLALVDSATERLRETVRATETALEDTEERLLDRADAPCIDELQELRRRAVSLRRFAVPQLEALEDLREDPPEWLDERRGNLLRELENATERAIEALSATREHVGAVQDQIAVRTSEQMRRTTHLLAVVAAMFLPLNLFAALLGANVGGIPLSSSPYGFLVLLGLTVGALGFSALLLRRARLL